MSLFDETIGSGHQLSKFVQGSDLKEVSILAHAVITDMVHTTLKTESACLIALSGGSSPKYLYSLMADTIAQLPNVYFIQVDERWVNLHDSQSNAAMIADHLFNGDFPPNFITLMRRNSSAMNDNNTRFTALMQQLRKSHIDLTILGMGTDGHTASLFPDIPNFGSSKWLAEVNQYAYLLHYVPSQHMQRISLSPLQLQQAKNSLALITGIDKQAVLQAALKSQNATRYPILFGTSQNHYWCTDFSLKI